MAESAAVPEPSATTEFNLLGPLAVVVDGAEMRLGGPRQVAVLGRLVLSPGLVVSMDELADSVWDGDSPSRPDVAIRSYVSNLRRSIEPGRHRGDRKSCIESVSPGYRLVAEDNQFDAHRFEQHLTMGRTALIEDDAAQAVRSFEAAQRLWRGEACEGLIETDALLAFRSRMAEMRLATTELRCEATLALGGHESVIADLEAAISTHPLRERLTELAMLALYRAGRQSDALATCRQLHEHLLDKLGVTPGRPIQELEHQILTHDPALSAPPRSPSSPVAPSSRPEVRRSIAGPNPRPRTVGQPSLSGVDLVGRDVELRSLDVSARRLRGGYGVSVLVTGEHGIGKTSLIERYCSEADWASTVWGRCRAMAADNPLWPWVQILDGLANLAGSGSEPETGAGSATGEVKTAHTRALEAASNLSQADPTIAFRPIVDLLRLIASSGPLIIVIDDAQWADMASLELLSFAATALAENPVAFIVSWRDAVPTAAGSSLRALARSPLATRLELGALSRSAVEQVVEASGLGGRTLARRIWAETVGHPLFVQELLGSLGRNQEFAAFGLGDREPRALLPSANLRDTIMERIEMAHPAAQTVMNVAAIHREGFSIDVLTECVDALPSVVEDALDALVLSGLIAEERADAATYRFVHPIAAKAVASAISGPRRARLHATIGHAMWRHGWPNTELAHHFSRSGSTGTSLLAARLAIEASRKHLALTEIDEIESVVLQGLDALKQLDNSDPLEVELASFLAQVARLRGSAQRFETAGRHAVAAARRIGDDETLVEATLSATGPSVETPSFARSGCAGLKLDGNRANLDVLDACLAAVGPTTLLRSAVELRSRRLQPDRYEPLDWPDDLEAETQAGPGNPAPHEPAGSSPGVRNRLIFVTDAARALLDHGVSSDWRMPADRLEAELANRPDLSSGHERLLIARLRLQAAIDAGDRVALDRALGDIGPALTEPDRIRPWTTVDLDRLYLSTTADLILGRLGSAERALETAKSRCHRTGLDATSFDYQLINLRWEQGKFDELDELVVRTAPTIGNNLANAVSALSAVGRGDLPRGKEHLDQLIGSKAWAEAVNHRRSPGLLCLGAFIAHHVGDRAVAKTTLKGLLPLRGLSVAASRGGVVLGSASYFAGLASSTVGKKKQARELLQRSAEQARSIGAATWLCRTLVAQADLAVGEEAAPSTTEPLRAEAAAIAANIGAGWLDVRARHR